MPETYQVHEIFDRHTNEHQPAFMLGRGPGGKFIPAAMTREQAEECFSKAEEHGAYPLVRLEDGRLQMGRMVLVPEISNGNIDPKCGRFALCRCPQCRGDFATPEGRWPEHGDCPNSGGLND